MEFMQTRHGKIYTKTIKQKPLVVMISMPATNGNQAMLWVVTVDLIYRIRGVFSLNIAQTWVSHGGLGHNSKWFAIPVKALLPKLSAL